MKKSYTAISAMILIAAFCISTSSYAQLTFLPRGSQMAKVSQRIGTTDVTIVYSRPSVNDREVWGASGPLWNEQLRDLERPAESPWRAGANENTIFKTTHDLDHWR